MIHINVWSQELDSGVSISYKGQRGAPRYCHELEIAFSTGNTVSFWAANLDQTRDMLKKALDVVDAAIFSNASVTSTEEEEAPRSTEGL